MEISELERGLSYAQLLNLGKSPDGEPLDRGEALERLMEVTFEIGLVVERNPSMRVSEAWKSYVTQTATLITPYYHWLTSYIQHTLGILALSLDGGEWKTVCRRRSAIEFLQAFSAGTDLEIPLQTLEVGTLDDRMIVVSESEGHLSTEQRPSGIPASHWWWWLPDAPPENNI